MPSDLYQVCKSINLQQRALWAHLAALKLLSKSSLWQLRHSHQSSPTSCACHTNGPRWMLYACTTQRQPRTLQSQFVSAPPASTVISSHLKGTKSISGCGRPTRNKAPGALSGERHLRFDPPEGPATLKQRSGIANHPCTGCCRR